MNFYKSLLTAALATALYFSSASPSQAIKQNHDSQIGYLYLVDLLEADMNNDGFLDLVGVDKYGTVFCLDNNRKGEFVNLRPISDPISETPIQYHLHPVDKDRDGDLDIQVCFQNKTQNYIENVTVNR